MPWSAFPAPKCVTTTRLIWNLRKFAIRWILQTKCVGVYVKFHNLAILLLAWYRKRFLNHNWRPSWIFTSLVIHKEILTNCIAFVIHKNIYLEVNFVYFWYLEAEIRKFHFLACFFRIFTRGNFSTQIWSYLKHRSIYQLGVNADS